MKKLLIISTVLLLFFTGCTTVKKINGKYHDGKHIEFQFTEAPNKFEYYFRSEMGVLEYSTGSWVRNKNQIILNGFDNSSIKILNVENEITNNTEESKDKIYVQYTTANNLIKADVIINDSSVISISKDTTIFCTTKIKTLQVKSYLSAMGLLSSSPKIDTLYSSKIRVENNSKNSKKLILKFTISPSEFARTKLNDTITVKGNILLYGDKIKLKK
jgi:hypothetical protein